MSDRGPTSPTLEVDETGGDPEAVKDDDWRLEGIPVELRSLFRQLIAEGFPDRGESEDDDPFEYPVPPPVSPCP